MAVLPLIDSPDESVTRYGACNTLKFCADGSIRGYNTDVIGFVTVLSAHGFSGVGSFSMKAFFKIVIRRLLAVRPTQG